MSNLVIKTHRQGASYQDNQIYILNKGLNSGKPQKAPFTNSFVITFLTKEDADSSYWLLYTLWKINFWHPHLCGSVIPFLKINELKKMAIPKLTELRTNADQYQKQLKSLELIDAKEKEMQETLTLLQEMRKAIFGYHLKRGV